MLNNSVRSAAAEAGSIGQQPPSFSRQSDESNCFDSNSANELNSSKGESPGSSSSRKESETSSSMTIDNGLQKDLSAVLNK